MAGKRGLSMETFLSAEVRRGVLHVGDSPLSLGCTHRKTGACGGCYARLYMAVRFIHTTPAATERVVSGVVRALDAEDAAARLGQPAGKRGKR